MRGILQAQGVLLIHHGPFALMLDEHSHLEWWVIDSLLVLFTSEHLLGMYCVPGTVRASRIQL